jgi:hypothetical protein
VANPRAYIMDLPTEVLFMIVELAGTPLADIAPLDQRSDSAVKSLSRVNKTLRQICLAATLHHVRMWKKETNLDDHLGRIYNEGVHILHLATYVPCCSHHLIFSCTNRNSSLSIRSIGPDRDIPAAQRQAAQQMPGVLQNLSLVMSAMGRLRELRLVADNGKRSMEPVLRSFFDPKQRTFPTVRSLYLRTATNMATIFNCFPNLQAINFNVHGNITQGTKKPLAQELKVLRQGNLPIRSLAVLKTANGGWTAENIKCECHPCYSEAVSTMPTQ